MRRKVVCSYASRDSDRAAAFRRRFAGVSHFVGYDKALQDPAVDAVVIAVPPKYHLELLLRALAAGKHVLVEKPALLQLEDYETAISARDSSGRVVMVGENDHYKPLAVSLRKLLASGVIGELVLGHFVSVARKPKPAADWRNDESIAGGDAFFEEGIHWLHLAGSLGPVIRQVHGYRPLASQAGTLDGDTRKKSMLVSFQYDSGAVGSLFYSREIPSLLKGLRISKLYGRGGVITFESNGGFVLVRGIGTPKLLFPGFRDIRGYRSMYEDFIQAIREGSSPEMSLERAREDHRLMEAILACVDPPAL